ncbi:MAG: hypothetical protein N2246_09850, partial [Candidatus Sumerlaeia bacterium]|nr:hypothetical protein [Candidatus Sumerlaeia bacterium]
MKIFISDLHLGCGDARDDFLFIGNGATEEALKSKVRRQQAMAKMHRLFEKFIHYVLQEAKSANTQPELILLGDIFDLLQVEPVETKFRHPSRLHRIFIAHQPVFASLNHFTRQGGLLTYVIGNHDHELIDRKLFKILVNFLPLINLHADGKPISAYINEEWGIYAEHGNQLDPMNSFTDFLDPDELPLGSIIVIKLVNPFEPLYPLLDNIQGTAETLWYTAYCLPRLLTPELQRQITEYQYEHKGITATFINHLLNILIGKGIIKINTRYLSPIKEAIQSAEKLMKVISKTKITQRQNELRLLTEAMQENLLARAEKILRNPRKAKMLAKMPAPLNVLLLGHTHNPLILRTESGVYANCGCWRPRAVARYRQVFRIRQTLN